MMWLRVVVDPKRDRHPMLRESLYTLQDASILLRIWSIFFYVLILPSFRAGLLDMWRALISRALRLCSRRR